MKKGKIFWFVFIVFIFFLFIGSTLYLKRIKKTEKNKIIGTWYEESGMLFKFTEDTFYWYKDFTDLKDNYYKGRLEIKELCDFHLSKKEIKKEYGDINCQDYYEIKLYPKELVSKGKNEKYKEEYFVKFAMYFESNNKTYLYDFSKNKFYTIAKINNF